MGVSYRNGASRCETLPFCPGDATAGSESELQAVVAGSRDCVDLPLRIQASNYFANIVRRVGTGDAPRRFITDLERYLGENRTAVWENSWVRFPRLRLSRFAQETFTLDLFANHSDLSQGLRTDAGEFTFQQAGEEYVRIPVSYLLKISLAELIGSRTDLPATVRATAVRLLDHFLNDNTSPETHSFHISVSGKNTRLGLAVARESTKRLLFSQLLIMYANRRLGLEESGQKAMIYSAPHPRPSEATERLHFGRVLSRAFHESLPLRMGTRRGQTPVHDPLPPGAEPQPAECHRETA